jgi:hypothetical protein
VLFDEPIGECGFQSSGGVLVSVLTGVGGEHGAGEPVGVDPVVARVDPVPRTVWDLAAASWGTEMERADQPPCPPADVGEAGVEVMASPMLPTIGCRNPKYSDRAVVSLPSGSQKSPLS